MNQTQFDKKFDIAFHNALQQSFDQIKIPEAHIILESWRVLQKKLIPSHKEGLKFEK
jgi:hypothetical protein